MPVYEFKCDKCKVEREVLRPMSEAGQEEKCPCGLLMRRKFSPILFTATETGKDKILNTLNGEELVAKKNGRPVRSKRSQDALYRGVDYVVPLEERVFAGF